MNFAEDLPAECPPATAIDIERGPVYRLLEGDKAGPESFYSHAKRKKPNRLNTNPCNFASCSLLGDFEKYLKNLPNMRKYHTHVALLNVPKGIGVSKSKQKGGAMHVDFWCYAGKCLADCVVEVLPLPPEANGDA